MPRALKAFLRAPGVIVSEVLLLAGLCILGASLPQAGRSSLEAVARLHHQPTPIAWLVDTLGLDHVFTSPVFLAALGVASASLVLVLTDQVRRFLLQWGATCTEATFRHAPYRSEFWRATGQGARRRPGIRTRGKLGLAGSPLFHAGLLCLILAGGLRALFGVEAVVDLYEGERLPATVEAWGAQWPGPLGEPFRMEVPLTLQRVDQARYANGDLKSLRAQVVLHQAQGEETREVAVNQPLMTPRGTLFMDSTVAPAALVEWQTPDAEPVRQAILLERKEAHAHGNYAQGPRGLQARIRVPDAAGSFRPERAEVRILRGGAVLAEGALRAGESLALPEGGVFRLYGLPPWIRLHAHHDPALGLSYAGFALALLGAILIYGVVPVDEWIAMTPEGDGERVQVALRPRRFTPLFRERFERLVRDLGGTP